LYFGIVRERLGMREENVELAHGATVEDLLTELSARHREFGEGAGALRVAVDEEYVETSRTLSEDAEVAIIPPVSGGAPLHEIVAEPISVDDLCRRVTVPEAGAIATFVGVTRSTNRGRRVLELEYEAYASMAVSEFAKIAAEAKERWSLCEIAIVHRVGVVPLGEASVAIAISAPHRPDAIDACRFAIDRLKHVAPIWKKERFEGGEVWIGSLADCEHGEHTDERARTEEGAPASPSRTVVARRRS
jgi:molybdopterin synthase catalytic subunit